MTERNESYKGRSISVEDAGDGGPTLSIDGAPFPIHVHEDGSVESHELMFEFFGSPGALARALIDQMPAV